MHRSLRRRAIAAVLAALMAATLASAVPASASPAEPVICDVRMDNPHPSSTPGKGADAKGTFWCQNGSMTVKEYLMNLYLCPQKVSGPESGWVTQYGCRVVAESNGINNHDQPFLVRPGHDVQKQVPVKGASPVHGTGWWVACMQYYRTDRTDKQRKASAALEFTA